MARPQRDAMFQGKQDGLIKPQRLQHHATAAFHTAYSHAAAPGPGRIEQQIMQSHSSPYKGLLQAIYVCLGTDVRFHAQGEGKGKGKSKVAEKSMFHGKEEHDKLGRSWMDPPREQRQEVEQAYLPKRWIHTWSGHTKGVNAIRYPPPFPPFLPSSAYTVVPPECLVMHTKRVNTSGYPNSSRLP